MPKGSELANWPTGYTVLAERPCAACGGVIMRRPFSNQADICSDGCALADYRRRHAEHLAAGDAPGAVCAHCRAPIFDQWSARQGVENGLWWCPEPACSAAADANLDALEEQRP